GPKGSALDPRPRRRGHRVKRRRFLAAVVSAVLIGPAAAAMAQSSTKVPRISVLMGGSPSVEAARLSAFREGLEKLGYIDGQTIVVEVRYAMGEPDRLGGLAGELVALAPVVIVCVGAQEVVSVLAARRTIPIVFLQVAGPVEQGFVASLAHPGGTTTGFTQMSTELNSKRLELLHQIVPSVSRVAFLVNP